MDVLLTDQEAALEKRKAQLEEDDRQLKIKRARFVERQQVRKEMKMLGDIIRKGRERFEALAKRNKELELEFPTIKSSDPPTSKEISDPVVDLTTTTTGPTTDVNEDTIRHGNIPNATSSLGSTNPKSASPFLGPKDRTIHVDAPGDFHVNHRPIHITSRDVPGNMLFTGGEDGERDAWAVCCARPGCRTNLTKHGDILKGVNGISRHAKISHPEEWRVRFENLDDATRSFGKDPEWCEWYQFSKSEYRNWLDTGALPESALPRGPESSFFQWRLPGKIAKPGGI
ncbi:uncharacterized protein RCC_05018 [Ramularia collo-cygni]|uniref:Uncharacterized protein n=1 Tax=Ramularia collo-cygni TaxID=112498 RepID=A0A2D3UQJ1_9PEZI|nr:uncharacterized protein RCC_05018 [Ramularia collo-cygni]CZT19172.1 uncharacterized protein RCC_05018 [Ramularia collo-cygni]